MFLYEKKDVFDEGGNGPLQGLTAKTTPEGYVDAHPARSADTVLFVEESQDGITLHEDFIIGEQKEEEVAEDDGDGESEDSQGDE